MAFINVAGIGQIDTSALEPAVADELSRAALIANNVAAAAPLLSRPVAGLVAADLVLQTQGDATGFQFVTNKGNAAGIKKKEAKGGAANPSGFVPLVEGATYRFVNEKGKNKVLYTGTGAEGLKTVYAMAQELSANKGKKANWAVEMQMPGSTTWRRMADDDPAKNVFGKIAKVGLMAGLGALTGGIAGIGALAGGALGAGTVALGIDDEIMQYGLPIALALTPLGPIAGAALGSAIGTAYNGGNLKQILMSAGLSAATAGFLDVSGIGSELGSILSKVPGANEVVNGIGKVAEEVGAKVSAQVLARGGTEALAREAARKATEEIVVVGMKSIVDAATSAAASGIGGLGASSLKFLSDTATRVTQQAADQQLNQDFDDILVPGNPGAGVGGAVSGGVGGAVGGIGGEFVVEGDRPGGDATAGGAGGAAGGTQGGGQQGNGQQGNDQQGNGIGAGNWIRLGLLGLSTALGGGGGAGAGGGGTLPGDTGPLEYTPIDRDQTIVRGIGAPPFDVFTYGQAAPGAQSSEFSFFEPFSWADSPRVSTPAGQAITDVPVNINAGAEAEAARAANVAKFNAYQDSLAAQVAAGTMTPAAATANAQSYAQSLGLTTAPPAAAPAPAPAPAPLPAASAMAAPAPAAVAPAPVVPPVAPVAPAAPAWTNPYDRRSFDSAPSAYAIKSNADSSDFRVLDRTTGQTFLIPKGETASFGGVDYTWNPAAGGLEAVAAPAPAAAMREGGEVEDDVVKHLMEYQRNGGHHGPGKVSGIGSGQEDLIPAWLSDGEYVWSAQDVADLGDGSTDEGVRRLDKMRHMVRRNAGRKEVKKIAKPQPGIERMLKAVGGVV